MENIKEKKEPTLIFWGVVSIIILIYFILSRFKFLKMFFQLYPNLIIPEIIFTVLIGIISMIIFLIKRRNILLFFMAWLYGVLLFPIAFVHILIRFLDFKGYTISSYVVLFFSIAIFFYISIWFFLSQPTALENSVKIKEEIKQIKKISPNDTIFYSNLSYNLRKYLNHILEKAEYRGWSVPLGFAKAGIYLYITALNNINSHVTNKNLIEKNYFEILDIETQYLNKFTIGERIKNYLIKQEVGISHKDINRKKTLLQYWEILKSTYKKFNDRKNFIFCKNKVLQLTKEISQN